jgi:hypothetical protein
MKRVFLATLVILGWMLGCFDRTSRPVTGGYCLDQMFGGDHYNLTACGAVDELRGRTDNGPLDGTVQRIGWNTRYIVVLRQAVIRSEPDGWMILDTEGPALRGPLSDKEWEQERAKDPRLGGLGIHTAAQAWALLGGS